MGTLHDTQNIQFFTFFNFCAVWLLHCVELLFYLLFHMNINIIYLLSHFVFYATLRFKFLSIITINKACIFYFHVIPLSLKYSMFEVSFALAHILQVSFKRFSSSQSAHRVM